jgi:hypothetical protein
MAALPGLSLDVALAQSTSRRGVSHVDDQNNTPHKRQGEPRNSHVDKARHNDLREQVEINY